MTGRPVAAALAGGLLSLSPLTTVAAAGPVNQSPVAIAVSQNGVGINVCQTSCTQSVQVLNIAVVTVVVGGGPARRPVVALRPAALRFGRVVVGHAGSPRSVTVVETAGVPALITGVHLTGPAAGDFQLAPSSCLQTRVPVTVLAPRGRCAVVATFTPSAPGNRVAGLAMSVDGAPRSAALSGIGVAPVAVAHAAPAAVRAPQPAVSRAAPARAPAVRSAATRSPARARASRTAAVTPRLAVPVAPVAAPPAGGGADTPRDSRNDLRPRLRVTGVARPNVVRQALPRSRAEPDQQPSRVPQVAAGGGQIVTAPVSLPVRAAAHMSVESLADEVALQPPGGRLHVVWRQPLMWAGMIALACLVAGWVALALARQPRQTYGLIVLDDGIDEET